MNYISTLSFVFFLNTIFAQQTVGLFTQTVSSTDGYVLFAPIHSDSTYLIDKCGKKVHQWSSTRKPGLSVYLLPDGNLLRTASIPSTTFSGQGASGGKIEKYDWNSNLLWSYTLSDSLQTQNHDVCPMPNGNVIVAVWEKLTPAQAIAAGRNPAILASELWSCKLTEIQPVGATGGNVVWQWRLWDHLVQDFDSTKTNYGVVADHPELLNLNFNGTNAATSVDWIHLNAVTYNESLNQVMFSSHNLSEIYIIDHSTTTAEAAAHAGGVHNKGGDFLYRWGNPQSYNRGTIADRKLFLQHNPTWIPAGYPNANKIMIFNNGVNRPGGNSSSVDIISPPVDGFGNYSLSAGLAYAPASLYWTYSAIVPSSFFAQSMGSAQSLINGNIIICEATTGDFFEIDSTSNIVWDYINPVETSGLITQGTAPTTNQSFRCIYYPITYSGIAGHTLLSGAPIELNPLVYNCTMNTTTSIENSNNTRTQSVNVINPFVQTIKIYSEKEMKNLTLKLSSINGSLICKWESISISQNGEISLTIDKIIDEGIYFLSYSNNEINCTNKLIKISK